MVSKIAPFALPPAFVRLFAPFRRDLTLPLVAIVAAMVAVTVMIWGVT